MPRPSRRASIVTTAITLSLLSTLGFSAGAQAVKPSACHVRDAGTGAIYRSLGQAVSAAAAGTELVVRGTCAGVTTDIVVPLSLRGIRRGSGAYDTGRARIVATTRGPALRIDPSVDALTIDPSLTVSGGIVIGAGPQRVAKENGLWWSHRRGVRFVRDCEALKSGTDLAAAVVASTAGSRVSFVGRCQGPLVIDEPIAIIGARLATSAAIAGPRGQVVLVGGTDTGRPSVRRPGPEPAILVDASVDSLRLVAFRIHDGLRIAEGVAPD